MDIARERGDRLECDPGSGVRLCGAGEVDRLGAERTDPRPRDDADFEFVALDNKGSEAQGCISTCIEGLRELLSLLLVFLICGSGDNLRQAGLEEELEDAIDCRSGTRANELPLDISLGLLRFEEFELDVHLEGKLWASDAAKPLEGKGHPSSVGAKLPAERLRTIRYPAPLGVRLGHTFSDETPGAEMGLSSF